jgi:hypothetical protein
LYECRAVFVIDVRKLVDTRSIPCRGKTCIEDEAMTYYCNECVMNWHPYQCIDGACPECGGGTRRTSDPASDDADVRHRAALAERIKRERYERFEAYYAERAAHDIAA